MTTKIETEYPSSPPNDESDGEEEQSLSLNHPEEEEEENEKENDTIGYSTAVQGLLAKLESSGALINKPKQDYRCVTCNLEFSDWEEQENHLIKHISLPSVTLDKLPSDDEDLPPSGDENWSDEDEIPVPVKQSPAKTPQKIDISQILKKTGITLKKNVESDKQSSDSALNKLSGLGFTIKKNSTPIKKEKPDNETEKTNDVVQKLGKLGGIKLKLKSDGNNTNSFKVVNGLKDFKASDDEDEASGNEDFKDEEDFDDEFDKSNENNDSDGEHDSDETPISNTRKSSDSNESEKEKRSLPQLPRGIQTKLITPKKEPSAPKQEANNEQEEVAKPKPPTKVAVKQTPKRGTVKEPKNNTGPASRRQSQTDRQAQAERQIVTPERQAKAISERQTRNTLERQSKSSETYDTRDSDGRESTEQSVVVKKEVQEPSNNESNASEQQLTIFSSPIKSERSTPPLSERSTPVLAKVKSEPEAQTKTEQQNSTATALLPVKKSEDSSVTVIEINGDSNDEDDDCCVVSTTPAADIKPVIPKVENTAPPPYSSASTYSTSQSSYNSSSLSSGLSSRLSTAPSTEKQHNFNWNAPDSKPPLDILDKSADDIFESLLSTKKEMSISDASEYISLDTLGPQHTCDICNTRFTDISLLEEHKRMTGHSVSLVAPSSSTLMPYNHSSNILSSLLPVKQLAEQVGKLSNIGSGGSGFTHQQNVMINIQAYPGAGGVMVPSQPYNSYNSPTSGATPGQNMHGSYSHPSNNMYGSSNQPMSMPGQYQGSNYMGQGYGQYPSPMSKSGHPSPMPPSSYSMASSPYSTASPLQSMQQAVYGQSSMMGQQPGAMGPPGSSPSHSYGSACSPGGMKPPNSSGIKIQNIQTFPPGQMIGTPGQPIPGQPITTASELGSGQMAPGQTIGGQMPGPSPIRLAAGANLGAGRPRMPSVRGQRPTLRPGIQVHGQVRGGKIAPRMPMKRPSAAMGGPGQKRRSDMLLPGKHDNEDCHVMSMQKQRDGLPLIHSVQGAKDKLNIGSQISITKKTVNKEANAMANVLASRGISVKQKQKSRSPTPERPLPHIPNLGAGVSIKHTSKSSKFSIPEAKVGGGMLACKICKKMFMNYNSLQVHMSTAHHAQSKIPVFKCDECPASYPKSLQLQHHKRVFHNVVGPNRELGLPVVDLSQEDNLTRLSNLGIYSFIPLANREQANGCFGIPVISVHNMQNGLTSSLQALGADGLLSLGPLKPLPNS